MPYVKPSIIHQTNEMVIRRTGSAAEGDTARLDAIIEQPSGAVKHLNLTVSHSNSRGSDPQIELAVAPRSDADKVRIEARLNDIGLLSYTDAPYSDPRETDARKPAETPMELVVLPSGPHQMDKIDELLGKLRAGGLITEGTEKLGHKFAEPMLQNRLALKPQEEQKELLKGEFGKDIRNKRANRG